jgi:5'-3' exonuclease
MMAATEHLLVIDGDNLAHRLYHAVVDRPAAEAFGFALSRLRKAFSPSHVVVVFDPLDGHSWRRALWPAYKRRPDHADALVAMLRDSREQCRFARLAVALDDDVEADDLIGAYTEAAVREQMRVTIVSSDKDMVQLVRERPVRVSMHDQVRKLDWCPADVLTKFGVEPRRIPDLFALIGDTTDGYPGVPKIGAKTAVPLLAKYGSLELLLENKNLVTSTRTMELLREHEATARICYRIASLRSDTPLPVPIAGCEVKRP